MNRLSALLLLAATALAGCSSPGGDELAASSSDEAALEATAGVRFTAYGEWHRTGTEEGEDGPIAIDQSEGTGRVKLVFERVPTLREAIASSENPTDYLFVNLDIGFQRPNIAGGGFWRARFASATCMPDVDSVTEQPTNRVYCIAGFDKWTFHSTFDAAGETLLDFKIVAAEVPTWQQKLTFEGR